jgi:hypothetical protein
MTILFCDNSLKEALNFRGDVMEDYAHSGAKVVLVAPKTMETTPPEPIVYYPVALKRSGMNPITDMKYFWTLWQLYRRVRPDYIFHYTIKPNVYGSLAAWLCGIPSTAMIAGLGYVFSAHGLRAAVGRWLYRFALRFPEHVFVLNDYNRRLVIEKKICRAEQVILLTGGEGINLDYYKD